MTSIHDLSNETLLNIVKFIDIDDLEAFAATCRSFFNHSRSEVLVHRERRKQYSQITLGQKDSEFNISRSLYSRHDLLRFYDVTELFEVDDFSPRFDVWEFMNLLTVESDVTLYPRILTLNATNYDHVIAHTGPTSFLNYPPLSEEAGQYVLDICETILGDLIRTEKCEAGTMWNELVAVTLVLLSRVRKLRLYGDWMTSKTSPTWKWLTRWAPTPHSLDPFEFLPALVDLEIYGDGRSSLKIGERRIRRFVLSLPSLKKFKGLGIAAINTESTLSEPQVKNSSLTALKRIKSPIADLTVLSSFVSTEVFEAYLKGLNALSSFVYTHGQCHWLESKAWSPANLSQQLEVYCAHSLVRLELALSHKCMCKHTTTQDLFIGDLKGFQSLADLRLDGLLLCVSEDKSPAQVANVDDDDSTPPRGTLFDDTHPCYCGLDVKMRSLVEILPASIQDVALVQYFGIHEIGFVLDGVPESKHKTFPKLKSVSIEDGAKPDPLTQLAFTEAEILLNVGKQHKSQGSVLTRFLNTMTTC